jgi:hypothetical protein
MPVGDRQLSPLMRVAARDRFANFTGQDVDALYCLAQHPPAGAAVIFSPA